MDLKLQIESLPAEERIVIEMLRSGYDASEAAFSGADTLPLSRSCVTLY